MIVGTQATPLAIVAVSWQLREEQIDARPGDRLSWPVSVISSSWARTVRTLGDRSADLMVDTYLAPEDVSPPGFLRVEGAIATVEVIRSAHRDSGRRPPAALVETTLGQYDFEVDGFIITLEAGAVVTAGHDADDNRYETVRVTPEPPARADACTT